MVTETWNKEKIKLDEYGYQIIENRNLESRGACMAIIAKESILMKNVLIISPYIMSSKFITDTGDQTYIIGIYRSPKHKK